MSLNPTLNKAGEADRARRFGSVLASIAQPTPAMLWLERAGKQLRETRDSE